MLKPEQRAALEAIHARNFNSNQDESESCAFMAANGHPCATEYRALRQFFDGLKYACSSGARYFSTGRQRRRDSCAGRAFASAGVTAKTRR